MSERKVHVLPDDNLGGVLREFVEVDRKAKKGDFIVVYGDSHIYEDITAGKPYLVHNARDNVNYVIFYDDVGDERYWKIPREDSAIIEPTDIVRINDARYRLVNRKAKVGEKVLVVEDFASGKVGEIHTIKEVYRDVYTTDKASIMRFGRCLVLEPVESAEETDDVLTVDETEASKSVIDLLANLARRVADLEQKLGGYARKIDGIEIDIQNINIDLGAVEETATELDQKINRLGSANEQAITALARDIETWAQEVTRLTDNQSVTLTFDSATIAKIMAKVVAEWR